MPKKKHSKKKPADTLDQFTKTKIGILIQEGTSPSTLRAYKEDRDRFWKYVEKQFGLEEHYPVDIKIILAFILDHLEGEQVQKLKISTIKRYLSSLAIAHQELGYTSPVTHPQVKLTIKRARRAFKNQQPVQKLAATTDIIRELVATCDDTLHGIRNRALILVGFGAGGRRRDELASLDMEDVKPSSDGNYMIHIRSSKTDQEGEGFTVPVTGSSASALKAWLDASGITEGKVFRGIKRNGDLMPNISGRTICRIVQKAADYAGFNSSLFGAHSLRAGFITAVPTSRTTVRPTSSTPSNMRSKP